MYSGTRNVKMRQPVKEFTPDLSSTSRARKSLHFAEKNLKPEVVESVAKQVREAFPDMLIERRIVT